MVVVIAFVLAAIMVVPPVVALVAIVEPLSLSLSLLEMHLILTCSMTLPLLVIREAFVDATQTELCGILQKYFQFPSFRTGQEHVIRRFTNPKIWHSGGFSGGLWGLIMIYRPPVSVPWQLLSLLLPLPLHLDATTATQIILGAFWGRFAGPFCKFAIGGSLTCVVSAVYVLLCCLVGCPFPMAIGAWACL